MKVDLGFNQEQLAEIIDMVKNDPDAGKTLWKAMTHWGKGLQSQATIPREGKAHEVVMDEPTLLGGTDTGPNMVEMVLGAYGCCLTTGFVANAALRGIELEGVDIEVEGDLDLRGFFGLKDPNEVWPGYTEVRATVNLKSPTATPEQLKELYDAVVPTSPVGSILARPVPHRRRRAVACGCLPRCGRRRHATAETATPEPFVRPGGRWDAGGDEPP